MTDAPGVAGRVEALHPGAVLALHPGVGVGEQAALGAEVTRHDSTAVKEPFSSGPRLGLGRTSGSP